MPATGNAAFVDRALKSLLAADGPTQAGVAHRATGNHFRLFTLVCASYESFPMVIPLAMLAVESGGVVALRMMTLMSGGSNALHETELMVSEKVHAALEATASLIAGASADDVIHRYRQHVAANAARLAIRR